MIIYTYDGSFDGLLTCIYESYYRRQVPNKIVFDSKQENFLVHKVNIKTDNEKSSKVYNSIRSKISNSALKNVFYAFLSEVEEVEILIYRYLRLGWKIGRTVDQKLSDDRVLAIHNLRKKVSSESHALLGLARFQALKGDIYYCKLEPKYNIVGLLAKHFSKRLGDQYWVIHDVKRGLGVFYNKYKWIIKDISMRDDFQFDEKEQIYQELWKQYFKNIAIKNRVNSKLQKKNMPMRYWKYLVEKQ